MKPHEVKTQGDRIDAYRKLDARLKDIHEALAKLDTPFGNHACSAFTGNTRESRIITSLEFYFSRTDGGEPPVQLAVDHLNVSASKVGDMLRRLLKEQAAAIRAAMENL